MNPTPITTDTAFPPPPPPVPQKKSRKGLWIALTIIFLFIVAPVLAKASRNAVANAENFPVHVSFVLFDEDGDVSGTVGNCRGTGGYDDFGPGMDVTIENADGKVIATGTMDKLDNASPYMLNILDGEDLNEQALFGCMLATDVEVPKTDFYRVEIGSRGEVSYSYDELVEKDYEVVLSLGDTPS